MSPGAAPSSPLSDYSGPSVGEFAALQLVEDLRLRLAAAEAERDRLAADLKKTRVWLVEIGAENAAYKATDRRRWAAEALLNAGWNADSVAHLVTEARVLVDWVEKRD